MDLAVALLYWVIVALWLTVLAALIGFVLRSRDVAGTMGLLVLVLGIDAVRNIVENIYFGIYWGAVLGLFPESYAGPLKVWYAVAIPKVINLVAGGMVLGILLLRWLPAAVKERATMQQRVQEAEQQKRALTSALDESQIAVLLLDPSDADRRVVFTNKAFAALTGDTLDAVLGRPWEIRVPADASADDLAARDAIKKAIAEARAFTAALTLERAGGGSARCQVYVAPLEIKGAPALMAVTLRAAHPVEATAQLAQAERMQQLGLVASGVVHDFNNMLTVMVGNLEVLSDSAKIGTPERSAVDLAVTATMHSSNLVRHFLTYSRQRAQGAAVVDLNDVVREAIPLLANAVGRHVTLKTALSSEAAVAVLDRVMFENALMNLALNAGDAMPNGGALTLSTKVERDAAGTPNGIVVAVADTGQGMTQDVVDRVFEPFFTTKEGKGTGMGMPSVQHFVRGAQGSIAVKSAPGAGTTVTMRFPAAPAAAQRQPRVA
jgi:signal transduction histidine kinase